MKIIDSHCHPQLFENKDERMSMIVRNTDAGIGMIAIGTNTEDSILGSDLAREYSNIWATIGIHPNDTEDYDLNKFRLLLQEQKVVAVGEIGLDYYRTPEPEKQKIQANVFEEFLDLANEFKKPVVIHSRDAGKGSLGKVHADVIGIIKNFNVIGVAHSFTGTIDEAREYLNLGYYLGFNGIITFAEQYDDLVKFVPLDRILLETDSPFLAPKSRRGEVNEPMFIQEVAERLSQLKDLGLDEVVNQSNLNCQNLFNLSFDK